MKKNILTEVVLLHCIGVLMILFGHFAQVMKQSALGELLITGVPLFLFLSGYLTGLKKSPLSSDWLKRKCFRILTPYYIILVCCFLIYVISVPDTIDPIQWVVLGFNLQGLTNFLFLNDTTGYYAPLAQGLGHFWYVTIIMVCYLVIIPFSRLYDLSKLLKNGWKSYLLLCVVLVQPILLFYNLHINAIVVFVSGWLYARNESEITTRKYIQITLLMIVGIAIRVVLRSYLDDTLIYSKYISTIPSDIIGIWIFFTLKYLKLKSPNLIDKLASTKSIVFLESIIYEFFLIHHILIKGSWSLYSRIDNHIVSIVVIIAVTTILSYVCKIITDAINNRLTKKYHKK